MLADCGYVVVVDDDPSLRQMVIKYLEDNDVPTKSASNRTEFNRHFAGTPPSLIILDLRLGQDDGLDLLRVSPWRMTRFTPCQFMVLRGP